MCFFFFQAEDGIRDYKVTGVQTCALPIFDLLLGYTGIVSFAHTMFFGIGAYGAAIASSRMGAGWGALALGLGAALLVSLLLSDRKSTRLNSSHLVISYAVFCLKKEHTLS